MIGQWASAREQAASADEGQESQRHQVVRAGEGDRRETGGRTNSRKLEKKNVSDGDTRTLGDAHPRSAMEEQVASGFLQP